MNTFSQMAHLEENGGINLKGVPTLAIIIPVYKHSVLVIEALSCALREAQLSDGIVIIVNDGCPYQETHDVCSTFAAAEPARIEYLRKENGGLSAARNSGIRHALDRYPNIQTIYLMDADNRLSLGAMRRAHATLLATGADWVYPTIDKFGMEWSGDFSGPFNVLRQLFQNVCEAGSLIHRRVFDAGLFFDESMQQGYEDWDFWLQCIEAKFRGAPCHEFGFQYRARRESMVRDSDRDGGAILSYMHRKHKRLYSWNSLLKLEHLSAPRFCVVDTSKQVFNLTSAAGEHSATGPVGGLDSHFWGSFAYPTHYHFPNFIIFLHGDVLNELVRTKVADYVFWQIEELLESCSFVYIFLDIQHGVTSIEVKHEMGSADIARRTPFLVATTRSVLRDCALDPLTAWIDSLWNDYPDPKVGVLKLSAPFYTHVLKRFGTESALQGLFNLFSQLRASPFYGCKAWEWRTQDALIPTHGLFREVRRNINALGPLGRGGLSDSKELAVLLPVVSFGGVEQVGIQIARQFRRAGWRTRLIVTLGDTIKEPDRLADAFDTILFLNDPAHSGWNPSGYIYYGHDLQKWATEGRIDRLVGLLAGCSAVINCQAMHGNEAMGWMRRQGVATISSLHLIDRDQFMAPVGHAYLMLAYEHAYDIITTPSQKLLDFCSAAGVPFEKLLHMPNAPTFTVTSAMRSKRLHQLERQASSSEIRPLRVLSIGRLDRQKGVERLFGVIRCAENESIPIEWRLVGSRVLEDSPSSGFILPNEVTLLPAVFDREAVIENLLWADAVVLLSHWEGSPLLVLEAQSLGTIPIAVNVGALSEMIEDGANGVLVANGSMQEVVARVVGELGQLASDPSLRLQLGRNAMRRMCNVDWANSCSELIQRTSVLVRQESQVIS